MPDRSTSSRSGRGGSPPDWAGEVRTRLSPLVAVISENLARKYWGEPSKALGKRLAGLPMRGPKSWALSATNGATA